jgi:hypothetical protein
VFFTIHSFGSVTTALLSLNFLFYFFVVGWCVTKLKGESVGVLPDMGSMSLLITEVAGI